ncbi:MAG: NusG domain II-containing protein [Lachnospiraceae bacterium]|nr:NusG domain II-containing protein [Candidatus Equihabitans merdae]
MGAKKKQLLLTGILFIAILAIAAIIMLVSGRKDPGQMVRVTQDGQVLYTFDLSKEADQTYKVECPEGYNIIAIKDHKISVSEADCPDHICISMGELVKDSLPIVCMPHRLMIEYVEE